MLQALGKAKIPVISLSIGAIAKVITNYIFIGIPSININGAVVGTVVCYTIIVAINLIALLKFTKVRLNFMSVAVKPLVCSVLSGVAAYTSYGIFNNILPEIDKGGHSLTNIIATAIAVVFAVVIYAISMLLLGAIAKEDIIMLPKGEKIAKTLAKYGFIE
jgi:stage V sporulation protein B